MRGSLSYLDMLLRLRSGLHLHAKRVQCSPACRVTVNVATARHALEQQQRRLELRYVCTARESQGWNSGLEPFGHRVHDRDVILPETDAVCLREQQVRFRSSVARQLIRWRVTECVVPIHRGSRFDEPAEDAVVQVWRRWPNEPAPV